MDESKDAFREGLKRSKIKSYRQAFIRAFVDGTLIAFLIWGPYLFLVRLVIVVFVGLIYGAFASSARGSRWM
jgi:hypothetical protein